MTQSEPVLMRWDDEYDRHEVESSDETVLAERLAELDGVRRTLVIIYRAEGHMACGGSAERGLVLYGTFDNEVFYQLADPTVTSDRQVTVVAGGQPGDYGERFVAGIELVGDAMRRFLITGTLHPGLTWVRQ